MKSKHALGPVMSKALFKEPLKQEMTRQQVMQRVEGFNKDEPRDTKVQEKVVQPEQEQIQHERREQEPRPGETREPASLQQGARQELSRDQAEEELQAFDRFWGVSSLLSSKTWLEMRSKHVLSSVMSKKTLGGRQTASTAGGRGLQQGQA